MSKILIVEDNDLNLKLFNDLLLYQNYQVIVSKDGANLLEVIKRDKPNIILMDIQLKGISGIDIIKTLKSNTTTLSIPIIAITAFAMKNDEIKILEAGCEAYLAKPVSINDLFTTIKKFIIPEIEKIIT